MLLRAFVGPFFGFGGLFLEGLVFTLTLLPMVTFVLGKKSKIFSLKWMPIFVRLYINVMNT